MEKINKISQDFNLKVQKLINDGTDPSVIVKQLNWDNSAFSLVRSGRRNVPNEKYEQFQSLFKFEEDMQTENGASGVPAAKYIALLEDHNKALREKVDASLEIVLNNQLAQGSLFESFLRSVTELLVEGGEPERARFRVNLHREAIQRLTALKKKGKKIEIDSDDIISQA